MDNQQALNCLEDPEKLRQFIAKLKTDGGKTARSQMFFHVLKLFHMHKSPQGIFVNDFLQHTFTFCEPLECFQIFRLVSKPWKAVIEAQKFHYTDGYDILGKLFGHNFPKQIPKIYEKLFSNLKQIRLGDHISDSRIVHSILPKLKKLKHIRIESNNFPTLFESVIFPLIEKSNRSLVYLEIPKFLIPDVKFLNLIHIKLQIDKYSDVNQFSSQFNKILNNAEHLKIFELNMAWDNPMICDFITQNFSQHCTSGTEVNYFSPAQYLPVQTAKDHNLHNICAWKFAHTLQYLKLEVQPCEPSIWGWDIFETQFLQTCFNLKGILFLNYLGQEPMNPQDFFRQSDDKNKSIWQNRISILNRHGIEILNESQFSAKETQLSQNIPWRFKFG